MSGRKARRRPIEAVEDTVYDELTDVAFDLGEALVKGAVGYVKKEVQARIARAGVGEPPPIDWSQGPGPSTETPPKPKAKGADPYSPLGMARGFPLDVY